jgi:hypothetical protein
VVVTPFNNVVIVVGLPEATAEAVSEGVEVLAELASRAVDRLADEPPEVFLRPHLGAVQHVYRRHSTQDTSSSVVHLSILNPCCSAADWHGFAGRWRSAGIS